MKEEWSYVKKDIDADTSTYILDGVEKYSSFSCTCIMLSFLLCHRYNRQRGGGGGGNYY